MEPKKVAFLDRDGTINVDHVHVGKLENWQFTPRVAEGLLLLQDAGFALCIITNQSGIALNLYTLEDMETVHLHMVTELAKQGVHFEAIAYCPHAPQVMCGCRKPQTGMAQQIEAKIGPIDYANSWTIGDKIADMGFGQALKTHTALLRSQYWEQADITGIKEPELIGDTLYELASEIVKL